MNNNIRDIVTGLIELYDTDDPFELCECLDITLLIHDLGTELYGFFQRTKNNIEILHINSRLDYYMQKYICCHELGHAITQPELSISFFIENPLVIKNKFEIEADTFAAELLLDNKFIEEYEGYTVDQVAAIESVPKKIVELKLSNLV